MNTLILKAFFISMMAAGIAAAVQQDLPAELKDAVAHDSACAEPGGGAQAGAETASALLIRAGGRDLGTIVTLQGACHCRQANCDTLVYLRSGQGYRLALREKYASLHPMKIVKRGMPSLTAQFEVSAARMETTVFDWDGQSYRPSLCATVVKGGGRPSISRHACKTSGQ